MSQPAMSRALTRLRHMKKVKLFISTGRGVKPTPRALKLAGPTRATLDMVVGLLTQTEAFDYTESKREFNLVLGDYGEAVLLPRLMQWLNEINANVQIKIRAIRPS